MIIETIVKKVDTKSKGIPTYKVARKTITN